MLQEILLASSNPGKVREFQSLLAEFSIKVLPASHFPLEPPEETGTTFAENAILKARFYGEATGRVALADDSGLCIDALDGDPGVYSARWAPDNNYQLAFNDIMKQLVAQGYLSQLETEYHCHKPIHATFHCVLALWHPSGEIQTVDGTLAGQISFPPRGTHGFGYDPIFIPEGYQQTLAELGPEIKQAISHRAKALIAFKKAFKDLVMQK